MPEVGTVLGRFDQVLDRSRVWRVDWGAGLDVPEYQDPEVARRGGMPDIPIPPGSLIFFSFLEDDSWLDRTGVRFDRSLAVRRQIRIHRPLYVGDQVIGSPTIVSVECKEKETSVMVFVTIGTTYESGGEAAVEELVTYMTRHPRGSDG